MQWTEEAVEVLKALALEGRSASVIAQALGAGSRNAVIGKASRIGVRLNGDGRAHAPGRSPPEAHRSPAAPVRPRPRAREEAKPRERKARWIFAEAEVGEMPRLKPQDMRQFACRWPLGDPSAGDFAYCGLRIAEGRPYCPGHCRMAYRPPTSGMTTRGNRGAVRTP